MLRYISWFRHLRYCSHDCRIRPDFPIYVVDTKNIGTSGLIVIGRRSIIEQGLLLTRIGASDQASLARISASTKAIYRIGSITMKASSSCDENNLIIEDSRLAICRTDCTTG